MYKRQAIYGGLIYLYHKGKWSLDAILLTALAVVAIEAAVNTAVTSIPTTSRTSYVKDNQDVEDLVWNIKSDTFYRCLLYTSPIPRAIPIQTRRSAVLQG